MVTTYAPLLLIIAAVICQLAVFRQSRANNLYLAIMSGLVIWGLAAFVAEITFNATFGRFIFLLIGYVLVWAGLSTLIVETGFTTRLALLALIASGLALISQEMVLNLFQWGAVTAVPLVTYHFLWVENQRQEVEFEEVAPGRSAHLGSFDSDPVHPVTDRPVLDTLPIGILLSESEGVIKYANKPAAALLGVTQEDLLGQSIMTVLSRLPMIPKGQAGKPHLPRPTRFELNGRQIEGQMFVMESDAGAFEGTVAILNDVSAAFEAERSKNDFLTTVSNELRTPLTAIKGYVEMLESEQETNLTLSQASYLKTIQRNIARMVHQINSLIFVAAIREQAPDVQHTVADLKQIVPEVVHRLEPLANRNQLQLDVFLDPSLRPIQADSQHITAIFKELLSNSIQYTESGGKVTVQVIFEAGESPAQSFVVVEIEDTGVGIDPAQQKTIFDEFYQIEGEPMTPDQTGEVGVGLAIVRALVEAYNGRIWLESELGAGSKFTFILPVKQSTSEPFALPVD